MAKKHIIMEKAMEIFAEQGIESTSIQQITDRSGISKGAFYLYFKSKDELITSLIDYFMGNIVAEIEQSVSNNKKTDELLYKYIYISYREFQKQANFAKIFLKEPVFSFNQELLKRLQMYMDTLNKILLTVIQKQFPQINANMHLELLFTINGLIKSYSELFLIDDYLVDIELLCRSIVEKVTIIADEAEISVITPDYLIKTGRNITITKEQLIERLEETIQETKDDSTVQESLTLLLKDLEKPSLSHVIILGLLNNIRTNKHCLWVAYMYELYLKETN